MNKRMNVKINVWKNKRVKEQKKSPWFKILENFLFQFLLTYFSPFELFMYNKVIATCFKLYT
jgi:hypothetical protein